MRKFIALLVLGVATTTAAHAVTYTTSVTIPNDPTAPSSNFGAPSKTTNGPSYTVRTGIDPSYFYVDVATDGVGDLNDFANIYIGGAKFSDAVIIETTNDRVTSTAGGPYYSLAGTGFTYSSTGNAVTGYDISLALPLSFLETDPDNIGFITPGQTLGVGDQVRVSGSQSYSYTYVGGQANFGGNRLGSQIISGGVPEPGTWALMLIGVGATGGAMRASKRSSRAAA